ncbi:hypothetical protein MHT86_05930 [Corynebacterium mastitidis]|uniref:hypothetical protein n=1 Tax=Corynebacterium mastitidis TaxID=161890 RepID=UPI0012FF4801|nr:hypothetical protein [Corynebacterium mastitidis]MCH6197034.1 hypothetical protein [Corynebacterium mastitidis]
MAKYVSDRALEEIDLPNWKELCSNHKYTKTSTSNKSLKFLLNIQKHIFRTALSQSRESEIKQYHTLDDSLKAFETVCSRIDIYKGDEALHGSIRNLEMGITHVLNTYKMEDHSYFAGRGSITLRKEDWTVVFLGSIDNFPARNRYPDRYEWKKSGGQESSDLGHIFRVAEDLFNIEKISPEWKSRKRSIENEDEGLAAYFAYDLFEIGRVCTELKNHEFNFHRDPTTSKRPRNNSKYAGEILDRDYANKILLVKPFVIL